MALVQNQMTHSCFLEELVNKTMFDQISKIFNQRNTSLSNVIRNEISIYCCFEYFIRTRIYFLCFLQSISNHAIPRKAERCYLHENIANVFYTITALIISA